VFSASAGASSLFRVATGTTNALFVDKAGNVGIGTTAPTEPLVVSRGGSVIKLSPSGSGGGTGITLHHASPGIWEIIHNVDGAGGDLSFVAGTLLSNRVVFKYDTFNNNDVRVGILDNTPDATLEIVRFSTTPLFMISGSAAGDGDIFIVTNAGNVGIGTTSPSALLDVWASSTASALTVRQGGTGNIAQFIDGGTSVLTIADGGNTTLAGHFLPSADLTYDLGSASQRWRNLYVGTTTIGSTITINSNTITGSATTTLLTTGNSNQLVLGTNGNVGIGTTAPSERLVVVGGDGRLELQGIKPGIFFNDDVGGKNRFFGQLDSDKIAAWSDIAGWHFAILDNGNVGIGTTSPASLLEVYSSTANTQLTVSAATATSTNPLIVFRTGASSPSTRFILGVDNNDFQKFKIATSTFGLATSTVLTIDSPGNVGIGTTSPNHLLTVGSFGSATSTYRLGVYGSIRATGSIDPLQSFDIAERFPIDSQCKTNNSCPEVGDLVSVTENQIIQKSSAPYDSKLVGIVTENSAITMGGLDASSSRVVALAGRVYVKVSLENGPITTGDLLTSASATPGVAMRATEPGRVIGVALEPFAGQDSSATSSPKILVFVNPHWSIGSLAAATNTASSPAIGSESKNQGLGILDQFTLAVRNALKKLGLLIENGIAKVQELFAQKVVTKQICVEGDDSETICINKDQLKSLLQGSGSGFSGSSYSGEESPETQLAKVEEPPTASPSDTQASPPPSSESAGGQPEQTPELIPAPTLEPEQAAQ
jgi:hypothetical protein